MKTTIYELLGMIKDNKAPKKIMFKDYVFNEDYNYIPDYFNSNYGYLFDSTCITSILNDEVEILETTYKPDKIEKIVEGNSWWGTSATGNEATLKMKINEIIDILNKEYNEKN